MKTPAQAVAGWIEACERGERFAAGTETDEDRAEFARWLAGRTPAEAYQSVIAQSQEPLAS